MVDFFQFLIPNELGTYLIFFLNEVRWRNLRSEFFLRKILEHEVLEVFLEFVSFFIIFFIFVFEGYSIGVFDYMGILREMSGIMND